MRCWFFITFKLHSFSIVIDLLDNRKKRQNETVPYPGNCDAFAAFAEYYICKMGDCQLSFSPFPEKILRRFKVARETASQRGK